MNIKMGNLLLGKTSSKKERLYKIINMCYNMATYEKRGVFEYGQI